MIDLSILILCAIIGLTSGVILGSIFLFKVLYPECFEESKIREE